MSDRILIVEDEALVAFDLQKKLHKLGYAVAGIASTGQQALDLASITSPTLGLLDIGLKGDIDGVEAAIRMRQQCGVSTVFFSGLQIDETLIRAKTANPLGYLHKPLRDSELRSTLEIAFAKLRDDAQWRSNVQQKYQNIISQISSGVAHRLNSVLTEILQQSEAAIQRFPSFSLEDLTGIRCSARRASEIIHQLMILCGQGFSSNVTLDLNSFARRQYELVASIHNQAFDVELNLPERPLWIHVDENQLGKIFLNLMSYGQAIRNSSSSLPIEIESFASGEWAVMTVRVPSQPISAALKAELFTPYGVSYPGRMDDGLELSIVEALINQQGGNIRFANDSPSHIRFTLRWPLASAPEPADYAPSA